MQIDHYKEIHRNHPGYGIGGNAHHYYIAAIMHYMGYHDAIDYGCGKGGLADQLDNEIGFTCARYDPAIPGIDVLPKEKKYDVVVNTDVLEHIPEVELDQVMHDFRMLSSNAIIIPHLSKAKKILPNGENAHCTIKTPDEWVLFLRQHYGFVKELPHHSPNHALFLCSDQETVIQGLNGILDLYAASKRESASNKLPLRKRFKKAFRILLGKDLKR